VTYTAGGMENWLICGTSFCGLSVAGLGHLHIGVPSWFTVFRTASDNLISSPQHEQVFYYH
jgi:hypothetical protein